MLKGLPNQMIVRPLKHSPWLPQDGQQRSIASPKSEVKIDTSLGNVVGSYTPEYTPGVAGKFIYLKPVQPRRAIGLPAPRQSGIERPNLVTFKVHRRDAVSLRDLCNKRRVEFGN
jgi:hypothetical protein